MDDSECVSASSDGSCIIWDLHTFKRRTSLFANTFFKSVIYHPDESQLVTTGTDRKVRRLRLLRLPLPLSGCVLADLYAQGCC